MRQRLFFIGEHGSRVEFDVEKDGDAPIVLTSRFKPRRDPDTDSFATADEAADAIADRVTSHLAEYRARLQYIRWRFSLAPITVYHLGRFAVSILEDDMGAREAPGRAGE